MSKWYVRTREDFYSLELGEFDTPEEARAVADEAYPDWEDLFDGNIGVSRED